MECDIEHRILQCHHRVINLPLLSNFGCGDCQNQLRTLPEESTEIPAGRENRPSHTIPHIADVPRDMILVCPQ